MDKFFLLHNLLTIRILKHTESFQDPTTQPPKMAQYSNDKTSSQSERPDDLVNEKGGRGLDVWCTIM
jgi:hypothetical protein